MPTKSRGRFLWCDLVTPDVDEALRFYGELFGWTHEHVDEGGGRTYTLVTLGDEPFGGMRTPREAGAAAAWNVYFTTLDIDAAADLVHELGGKMITAPHDIPKVGRAAMFIDPRGTAFSVLTPLVEKVERAAPMMKAGELCWAEAYVDEPRAVSGFYTTLFGWQLHHRELDGAPPYHELTREEGQLAGVLTRKAGSFPNMWLCHVMVEDCEETARRAARLGATVLAPTMKLETVGSIAVLEDPTGAVFGVFEKA